MLRHDITAVIPFSLQSPAFKCGLSGSDLTDGLSAPSFPICLRAPSLGNSDQAMNTAHFNSLSLDELCILHQQVAASVIQRILVRKARLEE